MSETYYAIAKLLKEPTNQDRTDELKRLYQKITKTNYDTVSAGDLNVFSTEFTNKYAMEHREFQLTIPSIDHLVWDINATPQYITNLMTKLESDYNEEQRKKKQIVTPKSGDRIVIDYDKYAWVMLARGACSDEADAMGHCGNQPSEKPGDAILSFRSKVDDGRQKPHLTFILHKDGLLGEMKGRANQKPDPKYHPYIIDLLKSDIIKGITGGGYEPRKNFAVSDLTDDQQEDLLKARPDLVLGVEYTYYKHGFTDTVRSLIDKVLDTQGMQYERISDGTVYIDKFNLPSEMFSEFRLPNIETLYMDFIIEKGFLEDVSGREREEFYDVYVESSKLEKDITKIEHWKEIIKLLPSDSVDQLAEYLNTNADNYYEAFMADDNLRELYRNATKEGMIDGTHAKIMEIYNQWILDNPAIKEEKPNSRNSEYKLYYTMPLDDLIKEYDGISQGDIRIWKDIAPGINDTAIPLENPVIDYTWAAYALKWYLHDYFKEL